MEAAAQAQPNIALVKYWGKQNSGLNVPATPSLSITLDALWTRSTVKFSQGSSRDQLSINGVSDSGQLKRVAESLDTLRQMTGATYYADVSSTSNFPTSAGLASSASGFAALVTAASAALGANLGVPEQSRLARRSSASAARSMFGGFVELDIDQPDPAAQPLLAEDEWPLDISVIITSRQSKQVGSTTGMKRSADTSVFYGAWVDSAAKDFSMARWAVLHQDFEMLAGISEANCLKMHAVMLTTQPALVYWNAATIEVIHCVRGLRTRGVPAFFTIDAGPQVKIMSLPGCRPKIEQAIKQIPGVVDIIYSSLGTGAHLIQTGSVQDFT